MKDIEIGSAEAGDVERMAGDPCDNVFSVLDKIKDVLGLDSDIPVSSLPSMVLVLQGRVSQSEAKYTEILKELKKIKDESDYICIETLTGYEKLAGVLTSALLQAAIGKGKSRHALEGEPFEAQKICEITRRVGLGYPLGQAVKKAYESTRLGNRGPAELLGAINYLAAAYLVMEEELSSVQHGRETGTDNKILSSNSQLAA